MHGSYPSNEDVDIEYAPEIQEDGMSLNNENSPSLLTLIAFFVSCHTISLSLIHCFAFLSFQLHATR